MFYMPYTFICLTSLALMGQVKSQANEAFGVGALNFMLVSGYLVGQVGNHYVKIISFYLNIVGLLVLIARRDIRSALLLIALYWIPACTFVFISLLLPSISEICSGSLYVSNSLAATSVQWPEKFGITHILDLTGKGNHKSSACIKRVRVKDSLGSQGSLASVTDECMAFVQNAIQENGVVLVHCFAGQSRSAAFVVYYLMVEQGLSLVEAYNLVQSKRPTIDVSSDHMGPLHELDKRRRDPQHKKTC